MKALQSVKSFYKEFTQNLPAKQAALGPIADKTSFLSSFLAHPFVSEEISRKAAKYTVYAVSSRIPAFAIKQYELWCKKQAAASMEKLEPLLATNPHLSHTLLLLAAAHDPDAVKKTQMGVLAIYRLLHSAATFFQYELPSLPLVDLILTKSCKKQREQIIEHAICPLVENTYRKISKRIAVTVCSFANLALISSLISLILRKKILTPSQLAMRDHGITALNVCHWGITAYLYAPPCYHLIKMIQGLWDSYQATKTYQRKIHALHEQIVSHPNAAKLPKASVEAIAILLATVY